MGSKDLANAAKRAAERRELLKKPIPMRDDAPENMRISKADFIAKRRREKEDEAKVGEYRKSLKAEKPSHPAIKEEKVDVDVKKKGRSKKVD